MRSLLYYIKSARGTPILLVLLGMIYCGLNACKPIQIDDGAYYYFARQAEKDPLNPYGFRVLWYDVPNAANDILAPPLLPYSWALAMKVCGDDPFWCKLFLFPWSLLLFFGLHGLFRRFAAGWEVGLTAFTAFSPALLPSMNLMLDVPALALSLCAIHVFLRACDEDDYKRAVLAGLLAGLAIQTKYTGLVAPVVMVLGGLLFWRWRLIPAAVLTTAQVFVCWELLMALCYDRSHFFNRASGQSLLTTQGGVLDKIGALYDEKIVFLPVLFTTFGSVAPALILLALAALEVRGRWLLIAAVLLFLGVLAVALDYGQFGVVVQSAVQSLGTSIRFVWEFKLSDAVFFLYGLTIFVLLIAIGFTMLWPRPAPLGLLLPRPGSWLRGTALPSRPDGKGLLSHWLTILAGTNPVRDPVRLSAFLLLWLAMETAFYFPLTEFPAVRRVLGVFVVATLLTGRLLAECCQTTPARRNAWCVLVGGIVLGFGYFAIDFWNARAQQHAAAEAAAWVKAHGGGRVWYVGHWGFQYYAEHHGMRPLYAGSERVNAGDYVVVPAEPHNQQAVELDLLKLVEENAIVEEDWLPLRTVVNYYGGTAALEHHDGPRLRVRIYRVIEGFDPRAIPAPEPPSSPKD